MSYADYFLVCASQQLELSVQVLQKQMGLLKKPKDKAKRTVKRASVDIKSLLLPLELRLVLQGATVKFEHHPMEVGV